MSFQFRLPGSGAQQPPQPQQQHQHHQEQQTGTSSSSAPQSTVDPSLFDAHHAGLSQNVILATTANAASASSSAAAFDTDAFNPVASDFQHGAYAARPSSSSVGPSVAGTAATQQRSASGSPSTRRSSTNGVSQLFNSASLHASLQSAAFDRTASNTTTTAAGADVMTDENDNNDVVIVDQDVQIAEDFHHQQDEDFARRHPPDSDTPGGDCKRLCVRHQRMANGTTNLALQKSIENLAPNDQAVVNTVWSLFSSSPSRRRMLILQGLLTIACPSQLSFLSEQLELEMRVDPLQVLPREIALKVFGYLDAISLGRAAQVSRLWRSAADDDVLWRTMCEQHIEKKCEKCGWGLPLLGEKRRRLQRQTPPISTPSASSSSSSSKQQQPTRTAAVTTAAAAADHAHHHHHHLHHQLHSFHHANNLPHAHAEDHEPMDTETDAMDDEDADEVAATQGRDPRSSKRLRSTIEGQQQVSRPSTPTSPSRSRPSTPVPGSSTSSSRARSRMQSRRQSAAATAAAATAASSAAVAANQAQQQQQQQVVVPSTRPWKSVYCERLAVERNWRKGLCTVNVLQGHTDAITCLQVAEDLPHPTFPVLMTGSWDRSVRIWNLETGREVGTLHGHTRGVRALQFDALKLITASMDGTLKIWNWRTGECVRTLRGHRDAVLCLAYDAQLLVSGSADATVRVWDFASGEVFALQGHTEWVNAVAIWDSTKENSNSCGTNTPATGTTGASGGADPMTSSGAATPAQGRAGSPSASSLRGKFLFSASDDMTIRMWDLHERECVRVFHGHVAQVQSLRVFTIDEGHIAEQQQQQAQAGGRPGFGPRPTAAGASSSSYFGGGVPDEPSSARSPSVEPPAGMVPLTPGGGGAESCVVPANTRLLAPPSLMHGGGGTAAAAVAAAAASNGAPGAPAPRPIDFGRDNATGEPSTKRPVVVSASLDNTLKMWDTESGTCARTMFGHIEGVWDVDVDKLRIVSGSHDRTLKIWDRDSGRCLHTLVGHTSAVTAVSLRDGYVVTGGDDAEVRIWNFSPPPVVATSAAMQPLGGSTATPQPSFGTAARHPPTVAF